MELFQNHQLEFLQLLKVLLKLPTKQVLRELLPLLIFLQQLHLFDFPIIIINEVLLHLHLRVYVVLQISFLKMQVSCLIHHLHHSKIHQINTVFLNFSFTIILNKYNYELFKLYQVSMMHFIILLIFLFQFFHIYYVKQLL